MLWVATNTDLVWLATRHLTCATEDAWQSVLSTSDWS